MEEQGLVNILRRLLDLTLLERKSAQELDMPALQQAVEAKTRLMGSIPELDSHELSEETRQLSDQLRKENRRNAYLIWSSLNWVRETMQFYGGQLAQPSYSQAGAAVSKRNGGTLLSGKI